MAARIDTALRDHLLSDAGVFAIVGTRVYAIDRPTDSALPAIVFARTGTNRIPILNADSESKHYIGLTSASFDFVCLGNPDDYDELQALAMTFVNAMGAFAGEITIHGRVVILIVDEFDVQTEPRSAEERAATGVQFEIEAHFQEQD